jgi:16S rRNA (cytidine1402-2'-O)-methyltransferase
MPGILSIVATPIGNLEDITFRAVRTLRECDLVAAEDTRRTAKLLARYEIQKPLVSLREHNEAREAERLVVRMQQGAHVAFVTDAGTPGIADPGARLVRSARNNGITVTPIPGPNAIAAALSVAGEDAAQYSFLGFPPASGGARRRWLATLSAETRTVVFFEAPHRIRKTVAEAFGLVERPIFVLRELTKKHESLVICSSNVDIDQIRELGEATVVIPGPTSEKSADAVLPQREQAFVTSFIGLTTESAMSREEALQLISSIAGQSMPAIKKAVKKHTMSGNRPN